MRKSSSEIKKRFLRSPRSRPQWNLSLSLSHTSTFPIWSLDADGENILIIKLDLINNSGVKNKKEIMDAIPTFLSSAISSSSLSSPSPSSLIRSGSNALVRDGGEERIGEIEILKLQQMLMQRRQQQQQQQQEKQYGYHHKRDEVPRKRVKNNIDEIRDTDAQVVDHCPGTDADSEAEIDRRIGQNKMYRKRIRKHRDLIRGHASLEYDGVDPIWFLVEGPFVIFPSEMLQHLQLQDFVEYYRAFPRLRWSLYPGLLDKIIGRLTKQERNALRAYEQFHRERIRDAKHFHRDVMLSTGQLKKEQSIRRKTTGSGGTRKKGTFGSFIWRLLFGWTPQFEFHNRKLILRLWRMLSWMFSLWWVRIVWMRFLTLTSYFFSRKPHNMGFSP